jgi:hypothetical protein
MNHDNRIVVGGISKPFLEESVMRMRVVSIVSVLALVVLASAAKAEERIVPIYVSPSTINLQWKGESVTVHAEIPYSQVVSATVTLDGIPVKATFADNRGDLVAKFGVDDVKTFLQNIVKPSMVRLTLAGETTDGRAFSGTDLVKVIDVSGKK